MFLTTAFAQEKPGGNEEEEGEEEDILQEELNRRHKPKKDEIRTFVDFLPQALVDHPEEDSDPLSCGSKKHNVFNGFTEEIKANSR